MSNKLLSLWAEGKPACNGWVTVPHAVLAEAMAVAGWDSVTLDMHHGFIDLPDLVNLIAALQAAPTAPVPLVRVRWNDPGVIYRVLDAGAMGVICPMVNTAQEAQALVKAVKYPPVGQRSFGPIRPLLRQGPAYVSGANANCLALAQIETRQALENIDSILAVPGLDGVYVGPSDLAFDMGMPPHFDTEQAPLLQAYERIVASARQHGRIACMHNNTPAYAKRMVDMGFQLVTFGSDLGFVTVAGQAAVGAVRAATGGTTAGAAKTGY